MKRFFPQLSVILIAIAETGLSINKYAQENFFEGKELAAARAIKARENSKLPELLRCCGLRFRRKILRRYKLSLSPALNRTSRVFKDWVLLFLLRFKIKIYVT